MGVSSFVRLLKFVYTTCAKVGEIIRATKGISTDVKYIFEANEFLSF